MGIKKSNINRAFTTAGSLKQLELTNFFSFGIFVPQIKATTIELMAH